MNKMCLFYVLHTYAKYQQPKGNYKKVMIYISPIELQATALKNSIILHTK